MDKAVENILRGLPLAGILTALLGLFVDSDAVLSVGIATAVASISVVVVRWVLGWR